MRRLKKFFKGNGGYPKLKKRHSDDGFRYPQGFKVDADNGRIFLPKIGYVRYRNSRKIEGIPKNVTVREERRRLVCFHSMRICLKQSHYGTES